MVKSRLTFLCLLLGLLLWAPAKAAVPASSVSVQHLYQYDKAHVLNVSEGGTSSGIRYLNFNGRTSNISLLIQYADAISQGWNLRRLNNYDSEHNTFVGGYHRSLSWTYVYTGSGPVTGTVKDLFENYTGQVSIHVSADKNSFSGQIRIVSSMKYEDLGLRSDGSLVPVGPKGPSYASTLKKSGDTYSTSDGRLSTRLG